MLEVFWLVGLASAYQSAYQRPRVVVHGKERIHRDRSAGQQCARTDLQSSMVGGLPSRLTRDQVNAPQFFGSGTREQGNDHVGIHRGVVAAARSSLSACSCVKDLDGRPGGAVPSVGRTTAQHCA